MSEELNKGYPASYFLNGHVSRVNDRFPAIWRYNQEKNEHMTIRITEELFKRALWRCVDECERVDPLKLFSKDNEKTKGDFAVLLSGGLDSSYLTALLAKNHKRDFDTYTLRYICNADPELSKNSDVEYALKLSEELGLIHHQIELTGKEALDSLEDIIALFEEPYSGSFSHFFALKALPDHVDYIFTGDGADELFMGYPLHLTAMNEEGISFMELLAHQWRMPPSLLGSLIEDQEALSSIGMGEYLEELEDLFSGGDRAISVADNYLYKDVLPNQILMATDIFSKHFGKRILSPYLDDELIDHVRRIEPSYKLSGAETKHILRTMARKVLPEEYINRRKEMFVPPITYWMMDEWKEAVTDILGFEHLSGNSILDAGGVYYLLKDFYSAPLTRMRTGELIWTLLVFQLWYEKNA
ncbi:MAG: asparagine synthase [Lachnospiraceae bacterium]|nr:asparagine synthase [Lachnospiraceae bacterium]